MEADADVARRLLAAVRRRPLVAWLVDELQQRYDVPRKIGQAWVDADQVLPLLDGLDEVQSEHRASCAAAINTFRQDHGLLPLAICSRITEYDALGVQLRLQGAIVAQPLTRPQVDSYLAQVGPPLAAVREALQEDPTLWELLETPLMLTIVTLAYAGESVEALRMCRTLEERRQHLFAAYVDRMFQRRSAITYYARQQTERWLAWLAWQMVQHSQTVFYLERLQPDWLPQEQRWVPTHGARLLMIGLGGGLVGGLIGGLVIGLGGHPRAGLGMGLGGGLFGGMLGGLFGYSKEITSIETVRWLWSGFLAELLLPSRRRLGGGLSVGLFGGLSVGLLDGLLWGLREGLLAGLGSGLSVILISRLGTVLGFGLVFGLGFGLVDPLGAQLLGELETALSLGLVGGLLIGLIYKVSTGLASGLSGGEISTKTTPNEGIHRSARMGLISGLGTGLIFALGFGLLGGLLGGLIKGLGTGLGIGLTTGIRYGGRACLQHLFLRLMLRYNGSVPWQYVDFLDYAAERLFLRKVGGGYLFIHRLLQDYFAARYTEPRKDVPQESAERRPPVAS